jgi:UDP-N-acetyl-D-glucosamine dehydrogenase
MPDTVQKSLKSSQAVELAKRIEDRTSYVGIIGMGYVGLPLAVATFTAGYSVVGFDVDPVKISTLNRGASYIGRIGDEIVSDMRASGRFEATADYARLAKCDVIVLCVPTPLNKHREPDLSYVTNTTLSLAPYLRLGHLIALESTTYPGTTREVMRPILEAGGLKSGHDFFMAFSPEREDPGNPNYHTATIPKVVGGDGTDASILAGKFYGSVVKRVVEVSSCEVAEAVKLTENIFRSVNIALVNELKIIYDRMGIDVWEVIEAAKTKPFGYMAFYPGPGLGGHCIPIDPFYLTWKAREYNVHTRFIELAGEINTQAPVHVVEKLVDALSRRKQKSINGARILMFGVAYKKNVEDTRESPAFSLIQLIEEKGGTVDFYDPYVPVIPHMREHAEMSGRRSLEFDVKVFGLYDAALICTDHDNVDYKAIADAMDLVIDTRNSMKSIVDRTNLVMA